MSLGNEYETSKFGRTTSIAIAGTTLQRTLISLQPISNSNTRAIIPTVYALQVVGNPIRIRQGDLAVTFIGTANNTGFYLGTSIDWRIDVDSPADAFLSVATIGGLAATLLITPISRLNAAVPVSLGVFPSPVSDP